MRFSERLDRVPPYLFAEIDKKIEEKKAQGVDVISFGVGDPDIPTPGGIIETLVEEARKPSNHRYPSYFGLPILRETFSSWFEERFGVQLDAEREVLPLIGSKEGIAHLSVALLDPGDAAIVPEPSYPVYSMGAILAGGDPYYIPLVKESAFMPELEKIPEGILKKGKILWINYPNNPTGAVADIDFFESVVRFALKHDLSVAHDNAYSEITYDGYVAPSILEVDGAKDCCIEFHSLSKTFNMTGWRIGFACGNAQLVNALGIVKTNIDSGIFNPIQLCGVHALRNEARALAEMREIYKKRRDYLVRELKSMGFSVTPPLGSIYLWMEVPEGFDSVEFSKFTLERAGVFFTPGNAYGPSGEGYVRISLTVPEERISEAVGRLKEIF